MKQYLDVLKDVLENGVSDDDRTGTGTRGVFGRQLRFDLRESFPLLTTKKVHLKSIIHELLWIVKGETNIKYLTDNKVKIWNEWATEDGELGPVYGQMLRNFPHPKKLGMGTEIVGCDQLQNLVKELRENPTSRRMVVSMWHPGLLPDTSISPSENAAVGKQALPPCHTLFQCQTEPMTFEQRVAHALTIGLDKPMSEIDEDDHESMLALLNGEEVPSRYLSLQLYQRSADILLGVPFNIASYSMLTIMLAHTCNLVPKEFIHTFGDLHLYNNHVEQAKTQLRRKPLDPPTMTITDCGLEIDQYNFDDFKLSGYVNHAAIKAQVAV